MARSVGSRANPRRGVRRAGDGSERGHGPVLGRPRSGGAALGGARLAQRLVPLLDCLSEHPTASIPQGGGTWAQTQVAYRFFDNPRVTPDAILTPHRAETVQRAAKYPVILAVQDTTVFNFTRHRHTPGVGPIGQAGLSGCFLADSG